MISGRKGRGGEDHLFSIIRFCGVARLISLTYCSKFSSTVLSFKLLIYSILTHCFYVGNNQARIVNPLVDQYQVTKAMSHRFREMAILAKANANKLEVILDRIFTLISVQTNTRLVNITCYLIQRRDFKAQFRSKSPIWLMSRDLV